MSKLKIRNMKKVVLSLVLMIAAVTVSAQQIAVVSSSGATTMCQTLGDAISKASSNSVIYLPAGGFQITDDVKISKKLTIVGVTHKANSDNVEGNTIISGNLNFVGGSDNSAVMGCYISGNVNIGYDESEISGILIKYCNLNAVSVKGPNVTNTKILQNYIRDTPVFNYCSVVINNNIINSGVRYITGGEISYNIFVDYDHYHGYVLSFVNDATINKNVFLYWTGHRGNNVQASGNLFKNNNWGDDSINLGLDYDDDLSTVFKKPLGCTPASKYEFIDKYAVYNDQVGLYAGGSKFSEDCLPPVPYVSVKDIDEQTDAAGNLKVTLRVKAVSE